MNLSFAENAVTAVLGYAVVFLGLVMLLGVVVLLGRVLSQGQSRADRARRAKAARAKPLSETQTVHYTTDLNRPDIPPARGSAGAVKLYDVPDRTAAMLMAIVAETMGRPVNELRFKSIRELK